MRRSGRKPGIGSTICGTEQVGRGRERERDALRSASKRHEGKREESADKDGGRVGKGWLVISWRVRGLRHVCLITFQSTRQSATPLSASHHPENYSFILEQLSSSRCSRVPRYIPSLSLSPDSVCSFSSLRFSPPSRFVRSFSRSHRSRLPTGGYFFLFPTPPFLH